jgi:archaemetzincin
MQIILQPVLAALDYSTLQSLADDVSKEFKNTKVTVGSSHTQSNAQTFFQSDFDRNRNQWNSPKLLQSLSEKFNPDIDTKTLFIFDGDAYSYGLNFVFGEAIGNGTIAIIYLPRIKQEFYGFKSNEQLFYERLVKESVHELGHAFGLAHCNSISCVMHFSNSLHDTDVKKRSFCDSCNRKWTIYR